MKQERTALLICHFRKYTGSLNEENHYLTQFFFAYKYFNAYMVKVGTSVGFTKNDAHQTLQPMQEMVECIEAKKR